MAKWGPSQVGQRGVRRRSRPWALLAVLMAVAGVALTTLTVWRQSGTGAASSGESGDARDCPTPTYFQGVWEAHPELGCPRVASSSDLTFQSFERGLLIWRKDPRPSSIYALDSDARYWQVHPDPGGTPEPACPDAEQTSGLGPVFGFGTVWCEPWGWKAQLRRPLRKEQDSGNGRIQEFDRGLVFALMEAGGFLLHADGTWEPFTP